MPNQQGRIYSFSANFVSFAPATLIETYEYDYLGNRTAKISNDVRTEYTTDLSTGYSQVLKSTTGSDSVYYTRGFELISRQEGSDDSYYIYDGGLSVRVLTDASGSVTDTLVFDAFGNNAEKTGTTDNSYGFQGEEQDSTGLYYLRARYMNPATGTFTSMDTYGGSLSDPMSLHKYLFANSNPVMYSDSSGHASSLVDTVTSLAITTILAAEMDGILYICKLDDSGVYLSKTDFYNGLWQSMLTGAGIGLLMGLVFIGITALIGPILASIILGSIGLGLSIYEIYSGFVDIKNGRFNAGVIKMAFGVIGAVFSGSSVYNGVKGIISKSSGIKPSEPTRNSRDDGSNSIIQDGKITVSNIKKNPDALRGKSTEQIAQMLKNEGYNVTIKNSMKSRSGAQIININNPGKGKNISQVQVSPGGGRHGPNPYIKISTTDQGIIKIVDGPKSSYLTDGKETSTIIFIGE